MGHRKWVKARSWREFHADDMIAEHNALYDAWVVEGDRADDLLKDRNAIQGKLDESRKRIAELERDRDQWQSQARRYKKCYTETLDRCKELESPIRVPFSDAQIERMAEAAHTRRMRDEERTKHWKDLPLFAKDAWRQGIRAALAAGGLEPCAVPEYDPDDVALRPSDDEVEALARALHAAWNVKRFGVAPKWEDSTVQDAYRAEARAAIAHLAKRPEGLPTAEELLDRWAEFSVSEDTKEQFYLTALRPWLRDPVGCELDVHPDQLELYKWVTEPDGGYAYAAQQAIDLCRSRIRPVYECKECAVNAEHFKWLYRQSNITDDYLKGVVTIRAALEGE